MKTQRRTYVVIQCGSKTYICQNDSCAFIGTIVEVLDIADYDCPMVLDVGYVTARATRAQVASARAERDGAYLPWC